MDGPRTVTIDAAAAARLRDAAAGMRGRGWVSFSDGGCVYSRGARSSAQGTYQFNGSGTSGQTFFFNVCGNTSQACSDYQNALTGAEYESWGMATQLLQPARGVNPFGCLAADNHTVCTDFTFGGPACCSPRRCEVVAGPFFSVALQDPANPATGGVVITSAGWPDSPTNDNIECPEQAPGLRRLRQVVLTLGCNPAGAAAPSTDSNPSTLNPSFSTKEK
jgi:hypothetical protein